MTTERTCEWCIHLRDEFQVGFAGDGMFFMIEFPMRQTRCHLKPSPFAVTRDHTCGDHTKAAFPLGSDTDAAREEVAYHARKQEEKDRKAIAEIEKDLEAERYRHVNALIASPPLKPKRRKRGHLDFLYDLSGEPWWMTYLVGCLFFWLLIPLALTGQLFDDE